MIQVILRQVYKGKNSAIGRIEVTNKLTGEIYKTFWSLEPLFSGFTRIPAGNFKLEKCIMIHEGISHYKVLDVPGHVGIFIHSGNTYLDSQGCILLGTDFTWHEPLLDYTISHSLNAINSFESLLNNNEAELIVVKSSVRPLVYR